MENIFPWSWDNCDEKSISNREICGKSIKFTVQGEEHIVKLDEIDPLTTLNDYLRYIAFLTGTKKMCNEGGCGACVVAVTKPNDDEIMAVNSCLVSVLTCHDWKIETIEGIGNPVKGYNPIQVALAEFNGTQCGYCSPGFVMNMYALCDKKKPSMKEVENSFGGNICRCTGYRPIITSFKSLCKDASVDVLGTYPDIEDFVFVNSGEVPKTTELVNIRKPLSLSFLKAKWIKVFTLRDLLSYLSTIRNETYMLVAGNTAKGVYEFPPSEMYIDIIEVDELMSYGITNNTLTIGANMSLTKTMELFYQIARTNSKFAYLKTMADHLDLVANIPVRNVGTLAGNLMIKYLHNEFPSDIFLIFELFAAIIVIVDTNGREIKKTLPEFLKYQMRKKVIKHIQLSGLSKRYKYETYKVMPRSQNAHAIVNAGISLKLDSRNYVQRARIIFGNIHANFIHASRTELFLIGKELFNNTTLQGCLNSLADELKPENLPPEPSPAFRKQLAISLMYKAFLSFAPSEILNSKVRSGGANMARPVSRGIQDYETNESLYPLTRAIPKIEAQAQTSGQAEYIEDIPDLHHQLYGKFILAKAAPNSKIIKIDTSKALLLTGVIKVFTKDDIPGENNFYPKPFGMNKVERIFCDGIVEYYDQPVGLLVATNRKILSEATKLVEIVYTPSEITPFLTTRDVLQRKAVDRLSEGTELKPKKIGVDVKHKLSGKFDLEGQYHFHMETQCCLAVPTEDGMDMYPSSQWMGLIQFATSNMLKIPQSNIHVKVRRCGGGFGAKISRTSQISCAAGLAAWLLKRPVRVSLTLKENMKFVGKRFPFCADYEVEVNDGGVIQHLTSKMYTDEGIGTNEILITALVFKMLTANYNTDPFDIVHYRVKTDTPTNTWLRAPGSAECLAFLESLMDHIAYELNIDPVDVRINNKTREKELVKYIGDLIEWAEINERKNIISTFNKENRWKKRGISVVPMMFLYLPHGPLTATISIYHADGSVSISHAGIEIGQGINTKVAQVCAYKLNIPMKKIRILPSNTFNSANCVETGGSVTTEAICYSVIRACDDLLLRLKPYRKEDASQTWEELLQAAAQNFVNLTAIAQYDSMAPFVNPYPIYGACAAEVEVDILTGQYQVLRVDLIEDVGTSLSPFVDVGQVEGAFIMGMGYYTTEKLIFDENGKLLTNNTWHYKPPGLKDIPIDFRIKFPKNNINPLGVLQSKAIGEPPLCLSVSVPLAIRNAVASARTDSDPSQPKYYFFDGPSTVENTFMNCLNDYKQYTL
ncbi:hypothetical protein WA026_017378 [Henosepilachna vigintioctopunctata]|uniref:Indole-3-acetaldehyde oxidase n=1 Tax=Henosepilachna vigintioctopunctata TaxID=420089 RepID=A0AAW1VFW3_9CUCU